MDASIKPNKRVLLIMSMVFLLFFLFSIAYALEVKSLSERLTINYLQDATNQRKLALEKQMDTVLYLLENVGITTVETGRPIDDDLLVALKAINQDGAFVRLGYANALGKGKMVTAQGEQFDIDVLEVPFFEAALAGKRTVSNFYIDNKTGMRVMGYAVPVFCKGALQGVLCALQTDEALRDTLSLPITAQSGACYIVEPTGTILLAGQSFLPAFAEGVNVFDMNAFEPAQQEKFRSTLQKRQAGRYGLLVEGKKYCIAVEPIEENGWMMMSMIDHLAVDSYHNRMILGIAAILLASFGIVAFLMCWYMRQTRAAQARLEHFAYVDVLTGARNGQKFELDATAIMESNPDVLFAVWSFDTKNFTRINDLFGTELGDNVLKRFFRLLSEDTSALNISGRIGSDVFVGLRPYKNKEEVENWFWSVIERIGKREVIEESRLQIDNAMGVCCTGDFEGRYTISELISRASTARRDAKRKTGNAISFYTEEMQWMQKWRADLEAGAQGALERGEITFFLQPKVCIRGGYHIVGAEALARWNYPGYGWVPPSVFIPLFEQNGFIVTLDRHNFEQVCRWYVAWKQTYHKPMHIAVNVSRQGFLQEDIVRYYVGKKNQYGIEDGVIELEFTESVVQSDHKKFAAIISQLKDNGFTCAIDDFGSGYSSLNLLRWLPVDVLKLDAEFFRGEEDVGRDKIVVERFIQMAQQLGISTVAEGIEKKGQVAFLQQVGCDIVQGYLFAKPLPKEAFEAMVCHADGEVFL